MNAIALFWVTAGSYPYSTKHDQFSLPVIDMSFFTSDQQREPAHHEESTLQPTLRGAPQDLPESFYDYLPRDQMSQASSLMVSGCHKTRTAINEVSTTTTPRSNGLKNLTLNLQRSSRTLGTSLGLEQDSERQIKQVCFSLLFQ